MMRPEVHILLKEVRHVVHSRMNNSVQFNKLIFAQFKDSNSIKPKYIGITRVPEMDKNNLNKAVDEDYEIFCSAFGRELFQLYS